ncbi:hypothetical protein ACFL2Z_01975 [Candidatus Eisenbacteria bacterium]|uniref:Peptidase M6-like domain-containing protein n=1 Tax=Eiseniibacteriota bacterium TaxID=2212470 RepID=A0ABV6YNL6_UNCEI
MRMPSVAFVICISVVFLSCSSDGPTDVDDPADDPVVTATIGPAGGTLSTDDFILDIPAGAFDASTELELYLDTDEVPYSDNAVSDLFRIEGLPEAFGASLRMAVKYESELSEESFIAIGEEAPVKSLGETRTSYALFEASDSSGYLVFDLSVSGDYSSSTGLLGSAAAASGGVSAVGLTDMHSETTLSDLFRVIGPKSNTTTAQLNTVGWHFDNAYGEFEDEGFSYDAREHWPVQVFIRDIKSLGFYKASKFVDGYGFIVLSPQLLSDATRLPMVAGHEFLHLVQDLYDSRPWHDKILDFGARYWLDEATASYCEELFPDTPDDYVPISFRGRHLAPLGGMHKEGTGAGKHGYGMASMIKYLRGRFLSTTLTNYYDDVWLGKHPVDAVIFNSNETTDWFGPFFREYLTGDIYSVEADTWASAVPEVLVFRIDAPDDTLKLFQFWCPNMGALLHRVELDYPGIGENSTITFSLIGLYRAETEISVLKYNGTGEMELIDHSLTSVEVDQISNLTAAGYDLYGLVTNRIATPPYTDSTAIFLNVKVEEDLALTGCYAVVRDIDAEFLTEYPDTTFSQASGTHGTGFPMGEGAEVVFSGNTLTQSHDYLGNDGNHYTGSMTVTFDAAFENVLSFSAQSTISKNDWINTSTLSGQNIPISTLEPNIVFKVSGSETCGRITGMTWSDQRRTHTDTLLPGWTCNSESEIEVWVFTN